MSKQKKIIVPDKQLSVDTLGVICYASPSNHPNIPLLQESLKRWGWPELRIYGNESSYPGHRTKIEYLKQAFADLEKDGKEYFLALDAYDTLCFNSPDFLCQFDFRGNTRYSMMFSGELACWPDPSLEHLYNYKSTIPKSSRDKFAWFFLNSGGILGSIRYTKDLMKRLPLHPNMVDDQLYWTHLYLQDKVIDIDYYCRIFQTTAHCNPWQDWFEPKPDGTILNKRIGSFPCFYHANGYSEYAWLVNHLQ